VESASVDLFVLGDGKRRYRLASFLMFFFRLCLSKLVTVVFTCLFVCLFVCCCCWQWQRYWLYSSNV